MMKAISQRQRQLLAKTVLFNLVLTVLLQPTWMLATTITDPLDNSANWGMPYTEPGKNMVIANGHMNFTSSTTSVGGAGIARNIPLLPLTQDWSVMVEAHLDPFVITDDEQGVSVYLGVGKTGDYLRTQVVLGFDRDAFDPNYFGVNDDVQTNGVSVSGLFSVNYLPSSNVFLRLDYNAANRTITYYCDSDGSAGGSTWSQLGTADIANGPYNLHLTPSDTLTVILAGWSDLQSVATGQAYLDNLEVTIVDSGDLLVTLAPTNAVSVGAQWQVDGGAWQNHSNIVSGLSPGNHTVSYKPISGWNTPSNQTVVVAAGVTSVTNGVYTPQTGSLLVAITPVAAVTAGAQWQIDGGAWQNHSNIVNGLSLGNHTVSYKSISGWNTPSNQAVTILANLTTVTNAAYLPEIGALLVTIAPPEAENAGAHWRVDGGPWQNSGAVVDGLLPGYHTVNFSNIADWYAPWDQMVVVTANSTTTANGIYKEVGLPVIPAPLSCMLQGGFFTMSYPVVPGQTYILQYTDDLMPPRTWSVSAVATPSQPVLNFSVPTSESPARYFRIRVGDSFPAVYSLNVVGYIRRVIQPGLNLVANPLNSCGGNSIANLFPSCPQNSQIWLPDSNGSLNPGSVFSSGSWDSPNLNLPPGEGVGFVNPAAAFEVTFAGEVVGGLSTALPSGLSLVGSILPVNGLLNFPAQQGDEITTWNVTNQTPVNHQYLSGAWQATSPPITPGEAFWVQLSQFKQWSQPFEWWNDQEAWESPFVTGHPHDQTKPLGATAHFSVTALGSPTLSYQWRKDGTNVVNTERIFGASSPALAVTNAQIGDAGNYTVVITNTFGSTTSHVAVLTVSLPPPRIVATNGGFGISNGMFGFQLAGLSGQTLVVEGSSNLINWVGLKTNVLTGDTIYFSDPQWTNHPQRYYRIRSP